MTTPGVDLDRALERWWHPVATAEEVGAAAPHPLAVTLLGRRLAVTRDVAVVDRCPHRSTRLTTGWVTAGGIRCAYHGWRFAADGACVEIPALPGAPIPARACVEAFDVEIAYDLVWVRLDRSADTVVPPCPAWDDDTLHVVAGPPYTWPTSAPRRVENFVDLAHFAWVHDGTLGRRDEPAVEVPEIERVGTELRFRYDPPEMAVEDTALFGSSAYRMPMPLTVNIEFLLRTGARRVLWMTASPVDSGSCRTFWFVSRDDDLDDIAARDKEHLQFQQVVLDQDEPVVRAQDPPQIPLDTTELSVRTDKVSIEYRRWLRELAET